MSSSPLAEIAADVLVCPLHRESLDLSNPDRLITAKSIRLSTTFPYFSLMKVSAIVLRRPIGRHPPEAVASISITKNVGRKLTAEPILKKLRRICRTGCRTGKLQAPRLRSAQAKVPFRVLAVTTWRSIILLPP